MTLSEIATKAAARVKRGWCQFQYRLGNKVCLAGAVFSITKTHSAANQEIHETIFAEVQKVARCENVSDWNDASERTQAEVVDVLRLVAGNFKGRGI